MRIEYHRTLIADRVRNEALIAALKSVIVPGKSVVADIGAGTGLLGLIAAKLGAREVYLYEKADVAGVAQDILKKNGARNCHVMPCHSCDMKDPPAADIVISETLGNYALEESIIETLTDARRRHLKRGGVLIPRAIRQFAAPVITARIQRELTVWDDAGHGVDLMPARTMSLNNVYVRKINAADLLAGMSSAREWDSVDLTSDGRSNRKGETTWKLTSAADIYGFAYWWSAELTPDIVLSTAPDAPPTHWEQLYFPLLEPIHVKKGEAVMLSLRSKTSEESGTHLAWTAVHFDSAGKSKSKQVLDLDKGWLP